MIVGPVKKTASRPSPTPARATVKRCSPLQFELDDAPALEMLLTAYPRPVAVSDLPHPPTEDLEDKVIVLKICLHTISKRDYPL